MIEVKLVESQSLTRDNCDICGAMTDREAIMGQFRVAEKWFRVGIYCCLKHPERIDERIDEVAERLERMASFRRSLKGKLKLPTFNEWQLAEDAYNAKAVAYYAECAKQGKPAS